METCGEKEENTTCGMILKNRCFLCRSYVVETVSFLVLCVCFVLVYEAESLGEKPGVRLDLSVPQVGLHS